MTPRREWEIKRLELSYDVVWSLAVSSMKVRKGGAVLTALTVATAAAFLMFLLTTPRGQSNADIQSWWLMLSLSLLVATVGVLNAMLMAVTQRYREIGTIKCLGGLDRLILMSLLVEALFVGAAGAVTGAVVGLVAGLIVNATSPEAGVPAGGLPLKVLMVLAIAIALTGLGAALPAFLASKMPPIEAMRGEK